MKNYMDELWLEQQYIVLKKKVVDIAKECNVNRKTINWWIRKFNFPKRKDVGNHDNRSYGSDHPNWKGDEVSYKCLHDWIRKYKPKPEKCQKCGKKTKWLDAANISGEYKRELDDFEYLCRSCHKKNHLRGVKN